MNIRPERPGDEGAIAAVIEAAFLNAPHRDGTEASIVERLREAGALNISLVAEDAGELVGHIAFSPVTIDGADLGWFGLGPVAVLPDRQGDGIGSRLIRSGLEMLRNEGAAGCVLVGEPAYYQRFGFQTVARLAFPGIPPEYFQGLSFGGGMPSGTVAYHQAFG
ncbi:N-acetyltransferase [Sphingomonas sp. NSE70-1]|uniref:N-acetyltransferase n=1 Tax=Sphingomonas caseinilyticus TaxID=2908205 RepID=A0ABT0RWT5_9SPHN|nr:N-acetyltransferase [Sphingomonas caseinilyticus]MCL6699293.1 N-acetyltransferase [Sphingomonas caseinilyticus]